MLSVELWHVPDILIIREISENNPTGFIFEYLICQALSGKLSQSHGHGNIKLRIFFHNYKIDKKYNSLL